MSPHPHELGPLLVALGRAEIELAPHPTDAGRLRHRPADLPPDLRARLVTHRAAVVGLLVNGYAPAGDDAAYVLAERLGVADGLGMPTHSGAPAWLTAIGESMGCSCVVATDEVHLGHGETDERDSGGGESEQSNALRDRQGLKRGP